MSARRDPRGLTMPPGRRIPRPSPPRVTRPAPPSEEGPVPDVAKSGGELAALAAEIRGCRECGRDGSSCAFGSGYPRAPLMLIKERPGPEDLRTETAWADEAPSIARALDRLKVPFSWTYGTTVVRRGDQPATDDQLKSCAAHLLVEIEAVEPVVVVAFGPRVLQALTYLDGRCGLSVGEVEQGRPQRVRDDLLLLVTEPVPEGVTIPDSKRRLWRDLQELPALLGLTS
ncbi:MAG TPA: uracil-DNA glycosylase family protein [Actinomycetota bacterium]|nr:uracil-DNA glycosylase family protein [Actinomycetota bacterium]